MFGEVGNMDNQTEIALSMWRNGPTQSERMSAEVLAAEGYVSIDPQSPLGGADGLKDVVCVKDDIKYIAAAYFPPTDKNFSEIEEKYKHDIEGVEKNKASGFVFFVNKQLSQGERYTLINYGKEIGVQNVELYHVERIRAVLDSPKGYGIRGRYLSIIITREELVGAFSGMNEDYRKIIEKMGNISRILSSFIPAYPVIEPSKPISEEITIAKEDGAKIISSQLSIEMLCFVHKAIYKGDFDF